MREEALRVHVQDNQLENVVKKNGIYADDKLVDVINE